MTQAKLGYLSVLIKKGIFYEKKCFTAFYLFDISAEQNLELKFFFTIPNCSKSFYP